MKKLFAALAFLLSISQVNAQLPNLGYFDRYDPNPSNGRASVPAIVSNYCGGSRIWLVNHYGTVEQIRKYDNQTPFPYYYDQYPSSNSIRYGYCRNDYNEFSTRGQNGISYAWGIDIDSTALHGLYVVGNFQGEVKFNYEVDDETNYNPGITYTGTDSSDIFIYKNYCYSSVDSMNISWIHHLQGGGNNDRATAIASTKNGRIYVTGYFSGTIDFDPSAGVYNLTAQPTRRTMFLACYNSNGVLQWAIKPAHQNNTVDTYGASVKIDSQGNVIVGGGISYGGADFDPSNGTTTLINPNNSNTSNGFVAKYTSTGALVWAKGIYASSQPATNPTTVNAIDIDDFGNVIVAGQYSATIDLDPGTGTSSYTSAGGTDVFLQKLNSSGNLSWAFPLGQTGNDVGVTVSVDANNDILLSGDFFNTVDFDPAGTTSSLTSNGSADIFIAKYTAAGAYTFANNVGSASVDHANAIAADRYKTDFNFAGQYNGLVDIDISSQVDLEDGEMQSEPYVCGYYYCDNVSFGKVLSDTLKVCTHNTYSDPVPFDYANSQYPHYGEYADYNSKVYYKSGIHQCPAAGSTTQGWTPVTVSPFLPTGDSTRTYARFTTMYNPSSLTCDSVKDWAQGCRVVKRIPTIVYPAFDQVWDDICPGSTVTIGFAGPVTGGNGQIHYQWYYSDNVSMGFSFSQISNFTLIPGATSYTYTPPVTNVSRRYVCIINTGSSPACNPGNSPVDSLTYRQKVLSQIDFGTVGPAAISICNFDPPQIGFTNNPDGGFNSFLFKYQWYYKDGIQPAPTGSNTAGWTLLSGDTLDTYDPPGNLMVDRTYACTVAEADVVAICTTPFWANGCSQVSVTGGLGSINSGVLATSNETVCAGVEPDTITFSTLPTGSVLYNWYYKNSIVSCPNATDATTGWTLIYSTTNPYYIPQAITQSRTYACYITQVGSSGCPGKWASGCKQVTYTAQPTYGTVSGTTQNICYNATPATIAFSTQPSGTGSSFTFQWYYADGNISCPTGTSTSGWTLISGATTNTYAPPAGYVGTRKFACLVNPNNCYPAQWATSCNVVNYLATPSLGTIAFEDTLCNTSVAVSFATQPQGMPTYTLQWYYQNGYVAAPTGSSTTGWTSISGATNASYTVPSVTTTRTYACFVTPTGTTCGATAAWANGCAHLVPYTAATLGTLNSTPQNVCTGNTPAAITFSALPSGMSQQNFTYKWYYKSGIVACPTGTSTSGWSLVSGATQNNYTPTVFTGSRTYACYVSTTCATSGWATGCSQITYQPNFSAGAISNADTTYTNSGSGPFTISVSNVQGNSLTYQWYYKDGIWAAPTGSSTAGWTVLSGANSSSTTIATVNATRTYACYITGQDVNGCGGGQAWSGGAEVFVINPGIYYGTMHSLDYTLCLGDQLPQLDMDSLPSGADSYTYKYYYMSGNQACPSGSSTTGWTLINSSSAHLYDPVNFPLVSNITIACFIVPNPVSLNYPSMWAQGCSHVSVINSDLNFGSLTVFDTTVCMGSYGPLVTLNQLPSGGNGDFSYQWYISSTQTPPSGYNNTYGYYNAIAGATSASFMSAPINGDQAYACLVTYNGQPCPVSKWVGYYYADYGSTYAYGTMAGTSPQTICSNADPAAITFSTLPGNGSNFTLQWYVTDGQVAAPTGNTIGPEWIAIAGATGNSYDPPAPLGSTKTFACFVTPISSGCFAGPKWATNVKTYIADNSINFGTISTIDQVVCASGDPSSISSSGITGGSTSPKWYYQDGIVNCPAPTDPITGWTLISGANSSSYDPPAGLTNDRTYACRVTINATNSCPNSGVQWSAGCRKVRIYDANTFTRGTIGSDQTICPNTSFADLTFTTPPSGATSFTYQWYYKTGVAACPTGTSTAGWTSVTINGTNQTLHALGSLSATRTYACFVTPTVTGCTGPGAAWANGCAVITTSAALSAGTLVSGNETVCGTASPSPISFATLPSGGSGVYSYKWYYDPVIQSCPGTGQGTTFWTFIDSTSGTTFQPPPQSTDRTYSCYVTSKATPGCPTTSYAWSAQCRQIDYYNWYISNPGTLQPDTQYACTNADPYTIYFDTSPSGSGGISYQWYYKDGLFAAPTGSSTTGWTLISGAVADSYNPPSGLTQSRTYACFVYSTSILGCSPFAGLWANGCRQVVVGPSTFGSLVIGTDTLCVGVNGETLHFATVPEDNGGSTSYQWYYQYGLVNCPTGNSLTGWNTISGATSSTYYTSSTNQTKTYACMVTTSGGGCTASNGWATGCRKLVAQPTPIFYYGAIASGNESFCVGGNPSPITFSTLPSGGMGTFMYQWYYKDGVNSCPDSLSAYGWTSIIGATSSTYDPPAGLGTTRTYACLVYPGNQACGATLDWASGCRQVTVTGNNADFGTLTQADETFCNTADPANIIFATLPSGGSGSFTYQWYYQNGVGSCPSGSSTSGWTSISGATGTSYNPPSGLTQSRTYACLVTSPAGNGCSAVSVWATQCRKVTVNSGQNTDLGTLQLNNQTMCSGGDPAAMAFATIPSGGTGIGYQWYYQDGLASCPVGTLTTSWVSIPGATTTTYDPPSGLTTSRTYACFVTIAQTSCGSSAMGWASQCSQVTITAPVAYGSLTPGNETVCSGGNPASITFLSLPTGGSGTYTYQWYYQDGLISCPSGSSTSGWTIISGATASSYDPPTGLITNRTYTCLVTASAGFGCSASTGWATQCRQVTIGPSTVNYGTLSSSTATFCISGDPANIVFSTQPNGGGGTFTYQWYYQNGLVTCPSGASTTGWTIISGATSNTYDPPAGLTQSRTYACFVSTSGGCVTASSWANQCQQITVIPAPTYGTLASGNETICTGSDPSAIAFATAPSGGSGTFLYQWYFQDGLITCPSGTSTSGWTSISGAIASTYDPPTGLIVNRTYACFVTAMAGNGCSISTGWATQCRQVSLTPAVNYGETYAPAQGYCTVGDPQPMPFITMPSGGSGNFSYQWYYQDTLANCPWVNGSSTTGWTLIPGATATTYDPPGGLTAYYRLYACYVTAAAGNFCPQTSHWSNGCTQITVSPPPAITPGDETLCPNGDPAIITFASMPYPLIPSQPFTYQWYYQDGVVGCPSGSSTTGWIIVSGATNQSYDPPTGLANSRTYACLVTGQGGCVPNVQWAENCRIVIITTSPTVAYGTIAQANESFCNSGDPSNITFSAMPSGGSGSFTYQWYYQDGLIACPSGTSTSGWTLISGATLVSYNPPSGLNGNRTYACFVTPGTMVNCTTAPAGWASQCRQVTIGTAPIVNYGTLVSGNQTLCTFDDPVVITFATAPSGGSGSFTYQWYFQDGLITCPSGSNTSGWTIINGATSTSYDPPTGGITRTFACMVTDLGANGCPATSNWATQCRQLTINNSPVVDYGTLVAGNETFCGTGDPSSIAFATPPAANGLTFSYQWFYQNGLITCPIGTSTSGWTIISGETANTYDPPSGLAASRTYACFVTGLGACGSFSKWATQCRQVTITTAPSVTYGTLVNANESMCGGGDPANITFSTAPNGGSGSFTYQWYYQDGLITCPTGSSTTSWTIIAGATSNSYDPPSGLATSRTFACIVTNAANGNCPATSNWATQCRQVTINSITFGTIANGAETICINGNPAPITFGTVPTGGGPVTYQWYYRNGTQVCPTGTSTFGMVLISGATAATYDPPAGLNQTRTYACMVTIAAGNGCPAGNNWATNCRIVTVTASPTYGALYPNTKRICKGGDPMPLSFQTLPSGGTTYTYQWYYKNGQSLVCPSGTNTSGWTLITGATNSTYDPPSGLTTTRTYACMVTSSGSGTCSTGTNWAANCVIQTVVPPPTYGTLAAGNESVCSGGNPAAISFSTAPAGYGTMSYQWYYKDGVTSNCPTTPTTLGWTSIAGATTNSYDPPSGLTTSRTYACLVTSTGTPCAASQWASNCRKVTIITCREVDYIGFDNDLPQYDDNKGEGVNNQTDNTSSRPQMDSPVLEQNIPNPFTETTSITCILPKAYNSAHIRIVNVLGEEIMLKKLSSPGVNKIEVNRGTLIPGIYFYSLYLDGKLFETKRMVITY